MNITLFPGKSFIQDDKNRLWLTKIDCSNTWRNKKGIQLWKKGTIKLWKMQKKSLVLLPKNVFWAFPPKNFLWFFHIKDRSEFWMDKEMFKNSSLKGLIPPLCKSYLPFLLSPPSLQRCSIPTLPQKKHQTFMHTIPWDMYDHMHMCRHTCN